MVEFPMHILYVNFLEEKLNFLCAKIVKFRYSEKATKFCEISALLLTGTVLNKSKVEISQNFVAFSEYMNFNLNYERSLIFKVAVVAVVTYINSW